MQSYNSGLAADFEPFFDIYRQWGGEEDRHPLDRAQGASARIVTKIYTGGRFCAGVPISASVRLSARSVARCGGFVDAGWDLNGIGVGGRHVKISDP